MTASPYNLIYPYIYKYTGIYREKPLPSGLYGIRVHKFVFVKQHVDTARICVGNRELLWVVKGGDYLPRRRVPENLAVVFIRGREKHSNKKVLYSGQVCTKIGFEILINKLYSITYPVPFRRP